MSPVSYDVELWQLRVFQHAWRPVCPDKLTSSAALVMATCSVSVLAVAPQCLHSVSGLVMGLYSTSFLRVGI